MKFDEMRWQLFTHICDKQDLDLKGENIKGYYSNFKSAFTKADNIAMLYIKMADNLKNSDRNESDRD